MEKKKINPRKWKSLLFAVIFLAIGIALCFTAKIGTEKLSVFCGVVLLFVGALYIVRSLILEKAVLTAEGVKGAIIVVFGVAFILKDFVTIAADLIPYFLFAIGGEALAEAFLKRFVMKQEGLVRFILQLVVGVALVALSICIKFTAFGEYTLTVTGVLFIVMAAFIALSSFVKLKGKEDEPSEKAEKQEPERKEEKQEKTTEPSGAEDKKDGNGQDEEK
jgi:uncharacterized membrane protein HdeD (DUF308 family)